MLPYFLLNIICYVPIAISQIMNGLFSIETVYSNCGAVFLGLGYNYRGLEPISSPCWFIYALFLARLFMSLVPQGKRSIYYIVSVLSIVTSFIFKKYGIDTLVPLDSALLAIPFLCMGYLHKDTILKWVYTNTRASFLLSLVCFFLWVFLVNNIGSIDMNTCKTGISIILFYITATIACLLFYKLSFLLSDIARRFHVGKYMTLVSRCTMLYIAFNLLLISFTEISLHHAFHSLSLNGFFVAILVYIEHIPLCVLVNKYCPVLIGKRNIAK